MERLSAAVGLGANVGDAPTTLAAAVGALAALPDAHLVGVSRLYRTRPVGVVEQSPFHNAAVLLEVPAGTDPATGAMALLLALKGLERSFGRQQRQRWGPRELDLDLLLFGPHRVVVEREAEARSDDPARSGVQWLEVPHPSMAERLFVLAPLADLAPALVPPGWSEPIAAARDRRGAVEGLDAVEAIGTWDPARRAWGETARRPTTAGG